MPREATMADRLNFSEKKIDFVEGHMRKRGSALLWLGAVFGLCGFVFAFITGYMKFLAYSDFPSGNGYFPSTVSEMVSDPSDPAGKAFFAFEFTGAMFIFLSWYPWDLRNVYIGDDDKPCCDISWPMFRQFVPAPGMMLVATVSTTPFQCATLRDQFTIFIHLCGAMMMFVGYVVVEMKTLGWYMKPPLNPCPIKDKEMMWRKIFLGGIAANYVGFLLIQVVIGIPGAEAYICCPDVFWYDVEGFEGTAVLMNTAHSWFFIFKILSYLCEVLCGIALLGSHFTIWYYCDERMIDLDETIDAVPVGPNSSNSLK